MELLVVYIRALVPTDLVQILPLPYMSCVTLGKSLTLSDPLLLHL